MPAKQQGSTVTSHDCSHMRVALSTLWALHGHGQMDISKVAETLLDSGQAW